MIHFANNIICFEPIGIIHTPFKDTAGMPIQPHSGKDAKGYIELLPEFTEGLRDLEGFSHITLLYCFHKTEGYSLDVKPFMDNYTHGLFATRVPNRPNPIGISTVKLKKIEDNRIYIQELDILDGSPLLDIKPYFRQFDNRPRAVSGWLDQQDNLNVENQISDDRFRFINNVLQG